MKFQRIAQVALVAMLASACSGDSADQAAETTTSVPAEVVTESTVPPATTAPTTTAAPATTAPAPPSLAFSSAGDVGRLFVVDGLQSTFTSSDGTNLLSVLEDNTLVQATSARSGDGGLWVRVRNGETEENLGWLPADGLQPTQQFIIREGAGLSGELRVVRRSAEGSPLLVSPGGPAVRTLASQSVAMHGGGQAIGADGTNYLDVIDAGTGARIGWIEASSFGLITSPIAQNQNQEPLASRADPTVTYGAQLQTVSVITNGCNASQVQFANPSASLGLAVLLGQSVPVGQTLSSRELWRSTGGGTLYVAPGDTATITVRTESVAAWYFTRLDGDFRAQAERSLNGSLTSEPALATNAIQVDLAAGSCAAESVPRVDPTASFDSGDQDIFDSIPADQQAAALERFNRTGDFFGEEAPAEEEETEDGEDGEGEEGEESLEDDASLTDDVTDTTSSTTTTTTTTAAPTTPVAPTTAVAPTTTTTTTTTAAPTTTTTTTAAPTTTDAAAQ